MRTVVPSGPLCKASVSVSSPASQRPHPPGSSIAGRSGLSSRGAGSPVPRSVTWQTTASPSRSGWPPTLPGVPKGSIALDGVSLTVNEVDGDVFGVNIIPHTAAVTTFSTLQPGSLVNIEIDTLARYVARLKDTA